MPTGDDAARDRTVKRSYHVHLPGLVFLGLTLLVGVAAANRPNNLLVWIFGALLASVLVSGLISGWMLMGIRAVRLDPRRCAVGEPLLVRWAIENRSRLWPAFNLRIAERPAGPEGGGIPWQDAARPGEAWVMHAGPRDTVHGEAVLWPTRRGRLRFDAFRIDSTFPFGLIRKAVTFGQPSEVLIHPKSLPLREGFLERMAGVGFGGTRIAGEPGAGEDYFGMREYRPGDSLRQVAWKRLASRETPVSVERSRTSPPRILVVLNLRLPTAEARTTGREPRELEEDAITLAASILSHAERHGFEAGLAILGTGAVTLPVRRGKWHLERMLAALAAIDLDAPRDRLARLGDATRDRVTTVVIHPDRAVTAVAPENAWHLVATRLDTMLATAARAEVGA
jgi:uncharacterized protein (DUF58 family)